jgi:N4-gp56 family major capsid protein
VHSKQHTDLLKDSNFISADKLGQGNTTLQKGFVGEIAGMPVFRSDRVTVTAGSPNTYNALILLKGWGAVFYKRRPIVESDRDILARSTIVTTNVHYAVKRLDDLKVVKYVTQ